MDIDSLAEMIGALEGVSILGVSSEGDSVEIRFTVDQAEEGWWSLELLCSLEGQYSTAIVAHPGDNNVDLPAQQGLGHGLMAVIRFENGRRKLFQQGSCWSCGPFIPDAHALQV